MYYLPEEDELMTEESSPRILFQEVQRFRQVWLWILLVIVTSLSSGTLLWMMKRQFIDGRTYR